MSEEVPLRSLDAAEHHGLRRAAARSGVRAVVIPVVLLAVYYVAPVRGHSDVGTVIRIVMVLIAAALVVAWEVRAVYVAEYPRIRAIDALAASVSVMIVAFAVTYLNLSQRHPQAFTEELGRTSALYFTLTTLATVGYGDIAARTDAARIAVMIQMVFNVAVIGTTVKLILGTARQRGRSRSGSDR